MVDERPYIENLKLILSSSTWRECRNDLTIGKFGLTQSFLLTGGKIPLISSRKVSFNLVAKELLWMIKGSTNSKELEKVGVNIWKANGSRDALDKRGLTRYEEGDLGPIYGFQWRHFGAEYNNCRTNYSGQGIDQLQNLIEEIKKNPYGRRHILSAWNPLDINKMALPPCHYSTQFYVEGNKLSCLLTQRSGDMILGVPFNMASYGLLTQIIAKIVGLEAATLTHVIGDAHIYQTHLPTILKNKEALYVNPKIEPFPTIKFNRNFLDIDDVKFEDFTLLNYNPAPVIKFDMVV